MITVTKKENLTYIFYDEELLRKCDIVMSFHVFIYIFMFSYIFLFKDNYIICISLWFIFCIFFSVCYKLQTYFSKIEVILYEDKIEIKRRKKIFLYLHSEIEKIEYNKKWVAKVGTIFFVKIIKKNRNIYKSIKGQLEQDILEIYNIIKDNYEEWRIKNYENCNREN